MHLPFTLDTASPNHLAIMMRLEPMNIRLCTPDDAALLALVGASTFLEAFAGFIAGDAILAHCTQNHSAQYYSRAMANPSTRAWIAELDPLIGTGPAPIGYALLTEPDFSPEILCPGDLELKRIYSFSRFYGSSPGPGPGQQLMDRAIAHARQQSAPRLLLGVHKDNARALAFYRRNGFKPAGVRTFQLGAHTYDDYVLALTL